MPAIWSSSERPLSVRTIWVDGIRHAILSPNDPLIDPKLHRRSRQSRIKSYPPDYRRSGSETRLDRLNSCFSNLHVVVGSHPPENKSSRIYRKSSAPPCPRLCRTVSATDMEPLEDRQRLEDRQDEAAKRSTVFHRQRTPEPDPSASRMERRQTERTFDTFWNPLFEKVLQWLDLSGRAHNYEFEEDFAESSPRDENRKWRLMKRKIPRFKRESFTGKEEVVIQNYKLQKDDNSSRDNVMQRRKLPKIRSAREDQDGGEASDLLFCVSSVKASLKMMEDDSKEEIRIRERVSVAWSPPRRLQLHVVMPNLASKENTSSQESLIND